MYKTGRIIGLVLMWALGVLLLSFAFQSSNLFLFIHGFGERIGCGIIGVFFILASVMNLFYREK